MLDIKAKYILPSILWNQCTASQTRNFEYNIGVFFPLTSGYWRDQCVSHAALFQFRMLHCSDGKEKTMIFCSFEIWLRWWNLVNWKGLTSHWGCSLNVFVIVIIFVFVFVFVVVFLLVMSCFLIALIKCLKGQKYQRLLF